MPQTHEIEHHPQRRIFATQRGYGEWKDWWEFPGGKITKAYDDILEGCQGLLKRI